LQLIRFLHATFCIEYGLERERCCTIALSCEKYKVFLSLGSQLLRNPCSIVYSVGQKGAWRTPESTLHALSLADDWPGALIAQQTLRHKSRKESFRAVFWMTVVLNRCLFVWLHTPSGAGMVQSLPGIYWV
jgi:uncharacterized membrane protein YsdA (DUF1294 family)